METTARDYLDKAVQHAYTMSTVHGFGSFESYLAWATVDEISHWIDELVMRKNDIDPSDILFEIERDDISDRIYDL
jgi:hypothetical protein